MRFLLDEQMPPTAATWLIECGHDATHVREVGLRSAPDQTVWDEALATQSTIITKDRDFVIRRTTTDGPSIVWVRLGNHRTGEFMRLFRAGWPLVDQQLADGSTIVELSQPAGRR